MIETFALMLAGYAGYAGWPLWSAAAIGFAASFWNLTRRIVAEGGAGPLSGRGIIGWYLTTGVIVAGMFCAVYGLIYWTAH